MSFSVLKKLLVTAILVTALGCIFSGATNPAWSQSPSCSYVQCFDQCVKKGGPDFTGSAHVTKWCGNMCRKRCSG
jgi:hypothetical protein